MMVYCQRCGAEAGDLPKVERASTCPACHVALHACVMCRHHDPHVNNQCRIPGTEWVSDRERGNFCDEFKMKEGRPGQDAEAARKAKAKADLDKLFGG